MTGVQTCALPIQLSYNMKTEGGFLPALAGLIPFLTGSVLPALGVVALSGLASTGAQQLIGNWLYLKKGSGVCLIETAGEGLYLGQTSGKGFETVGNGLFLMEQGGLYDGRGLILGPNSPFKIIPILGMILYYFFQKKNVIYTKNWKLMKLMVITDIYISS